MRILVIESQSPVACLAQCLQGSTGAVPAKPAQILPCPPPLTAGMRCLC